MGRIYHKTEQETREQRAKSNEQISRLAVFIDFLRSLYEEHGEENAAGLLITVVNEKTSRLADYIKARSLEGAKSFETNAASPYMARPFKEHFISDSGDEYNRYNGKDGKFYADEAHARSFGAARATGTTSNTDISEKRNIYILPLTASIQRSNITAGSIHNEQYKPFTFFILHFFLFILHFFLRL